MAVIVMIIIYTIIIYTVSTEFIIQFYFVLVVYSVYHCVN